MLINLLFATQITDYITAALSRKIWLRISGRAYTKELKIRNQSQKYEMKHSRVYRPGSCGHRPHAFQQTHQNDKM